MLRIERSGTDTCTFTKKDGVDGVYVRFDDTDTTIFLSWLALKKQVNFQTMQKNGKVAPSLLKD